MKISKEIVARWKTQAETYLRENHGHIACGDILTGSDAWAVAHRCGITREVYALPRSESILDAHI